MPDNKQKTRPQDAGRINMHEEHEVKYWTQALGVPKDKLLKIVEEVGISAEAVRKALKR